MEKYNIEYRIGDEIFHKYSADDNNSFLRGVVIDIRIYPIANVIEYLIEFGPDSVIWCNQLAITDINLNLIR